MYQDRSKKTQKEIDEIEEILKKLQEKIPDMSKSALKDEIKNSLKKWDEKEEENCDKFLEIAHTCHKELKKREK
jgi:hypothetical protein